MKKKLPLSHRDFKRGVVVTTENPRIVAIKLQADESVKKIKKEGINAR